MTAPFFGDKAKFLEVDRNGAIIGSNNLIELVGDSRSAAGVSFVDGFTSPSVSGSGTISLSNSGNILTIAGSTTNPDFGVMGFVTGDTAIVYDNSNAINRMIVSTVTAQTLTFTTTCPTIGTTGSAVALLPNKSFSWVDVIENTESISGYTYTGFEITNISGSLSKSRVTFSKCYLNYSSDMNFFGSMDTNINNSTLLPTGLNVNIDFGNTGEKSFRNNFLAGENTKNTVGISVTLGELICRDNYIFHFVRGISLSASAGVLGFVNTINDCDTGLRSYAPNSIQLASWTITNCDTYCVDIANGAICHFDGGTLSGSGTGVRARLLAFFIINAVTNTATTPYDPATALTPNATGGNGVGY